MPHDNKVSIERTIIGIPPTLTNPLGINSVYWPKRVPMPAAIIIAVRIIRLII